MNEDSEVDEISHQELGVVPGDNENKTNTQAHGDEDIDEDSESLDPRIQEELEKLNCSTDVINKLEVDLEVGYIVKMIYNYNFLEGAPVFICQRKSVQL